MEQPSELLRLKFQLNILNSELIVRRHQEQLEEERLVLIEERRELLKAMRAEVGADPTYLYNNDTGTFVPKE